LNVRSSKSTDADIVTQIPEGNEYQVSKVSKDGDWVKISIDGDLKGYVSSDFVDVDVNYGKALTVEQEYQIEQERLAAEAEAAAAAAASATTTQQVTQQITTSSSSSASASSIKPTANASITTSNGSSFSNSSSSSQSTSTSGLGSQIASYALQFVGNPYVYGGTSLTNGADCSGFTMSVYAHFGYSLPHNAASQSGCGRSVSLSELQPGDLLFYKNGGGIGHVAMYTGGGMVVHASNKKDGIKTSVYNYRTPCKAVRIIG
jgi:cell wall-associated NlpC family hydrolase